MIYEHTQRGGVILITLSATALVMLLALTWAGKSEPVVLPVFLIVFGIMALVAFLFGSLTVEVNRETLIARMGPGLIRKTFAVADVAGAAAVRNRWFYGFGVRRTPQAWMFNVSGLDAVELTLKNGSRFRIGTDEPEQLLRAVERALSSYK